MFSRLIFFILFLCSCNQVVIKDDYNSEQVEKYKTDFFLKYSTYTINDNIKNKVEDFISVYATCGLIKYRSKVDYDIIQSYQIYTSKNSVTNSTFDYELIHFKNTTYLDSAIQQIKKNNCIDERTQKIHRIYKVGRNTIIGVSFSNFDITDYEDFLFKEFDKSITIELINISG